MPNKNIDNLWELNIIDQILKYSKLKKKTSSNSLNHKFGLASLSIQASVDIYSKRINSLSSSTENFLIDLQNNKGELDQKDTVFRSSLKLKNIEKCYFIEKLSFSYSFSNSNFYFELPNSDFYTYEKNYKNVYLEKKSQINAYHENKIQLSLFIDLISTLLSVPDSNLTNFKKNMAKEKNLQLMNSKKITIKNILIKPFMENIQSKKNNLYTKKNLLRKKILNNVNEIKNYILNCNNKPLNNINIKFSTKNIHTANNFRAMNFYQYFRKTRNVITLKKNFRIYENPSIVIHFLYFLSLFNEKKGNQIKKTPILISLEKKRIDSNKYNSKNFSSKNSLDFKKKYLLDLNNIMFRYEKRFSSFLNKNKKFTKNNDYLNDFLKSEKIPKDKKINLNSKFSGIKLVYNIALNYKFLKKKKCLYLISNSYLTNKVDVDFSLVKFIKKKFFIVLKQIIFYQIKGYCQVLLNGNIGDIKILPHEKNFM